jgi:YHS domain-containing protein
MKLKLILPTLAIATGLMISGCKDGDDHSGHDHGADGGEHAAEGAGHDKDGGEEHGKDGDASHEKDGDGDATKSAALPAGTMAYTLDTCIVAGSKLGSMGDPFVMIHEGQEVKFCCEGCKPKFEADPEKYLTKLAAATPAKKADKKVN